MKRFKARQIYLLFIFILGSFLISGCGDDGQLIGHWLPPRYLTSIQVTPVTASIPVTGNQQFTAIATYSDGVSLDVTRTATWTSGTPANASVGLHTGLATGHIGGTSSVITATYGGKSGSGTLNVNAATSISFRVTPIAASIPVTGTQRYTAIETFSDGTTYDRTAVSTWTASNARATILTGGVTPGLATGVTPGAVVITATLGARSGTANLTVTAATSVSFRVMPIAASIPVTGTQRYTAIETFSDGTTFDRTAAATWSSSNTARATILTGGVTPGLATGITPGAVVITATLGALSGTANLTVTAATSVSFVVTPIAASIPVTGTQQYTAIETFSDGTTMNRTAASTWSTSNANATILTGGLTPGLATGITPGAVVITATFGALSATANLTVTPATSVSFVVTPAVTTTPITGTVQYTAIETFSDGATVDRTAASTWSASNANATILTGGLTPGLATGVTPGTVVITATYAASPHSPATANLTVTSATSVSFVVMPPTASVVVTGTRQFAAIETFSDGTTINRTLVSTWGTGTPAVALVGLTGLATGVTAGISTVTATFGARIATPAFLTVTATPPGTCDSGILPLGSATNFGVLSGTALSITNPTSVTGDVGSPSITPAAGPSTLVGTMYDTSTGSLPLIAAAVADMEYAIGCAGSRVCNFNYAAAQDFGGDVLSPGVHCVTGAMSVGSNLTLTTPGVYIFRSTGGLTSAVNVTVAFGGTANATNTSVFWIPAGAASIGSGNTFLGTIMPGASAAVTLGANSTLLPGRALSSAAVTLSTNTISIP